MHHGSFHIPTGQGHRSSIVGIYGQNGSGKTAAINALSILRILFRGDPLPPRVSNIISKDTTDISINAEFSYNGGKINYTPTLTLTPDGGVELKSETLCYARKSLKFFANNKNFLRPKDIRTMLRKIDDDDNIKAYSIVATKGCKSFLFSTEMKQMLAKSPQDITQFWHKILNRLYDYARFEYFVIEDNHLSINGKNESIPFSFRTANEFGEFDISLVKPSLLDLNYYNYFSNFLVQINKIIGAIVPKLSIEIHEHGRELLENGRNAMRFELVSVRDGQRIPLLYESDGIKKILSILGLLAAAYKDESILIAIDELDAGIFEYMLGEIIEVFDKFGSGQLIFTSHNLRPLEKLNHRSILMTTTNKENRYITLTNIKASNNLRDVYLRSVYLGGQSEELYDKTSTASIRRSFDAYGGYANAQSS